MPNYKKTKRNRFDVFKKKHTIPMHSSNSTKEEEPVQETDKEEYVSSFKIVSGRKKKIRNRNIIILGCIAILVVAALLWSLLSPTGIVEAVKNYTAAISLKSNFPSQLDGNDILNVNSKNRYFYTLTNSDFSCYSKNGKKMFGFSHKLSSPVFDSSESRALLYDQNSTSVSVYTAQDRIYQFNTDFAIYCGDISRSGSFALATKAENYTSMVTVYNKKASKVFEWFCPDELITSVALSSNGKKLAVASVNAKDGRFVSFLRVFEYDSAEPVFTKEYDGVFIASLYSELSSSFVVIAQNSCDIIVWKDFKVTSHQSQNTVFAVDGYGSNTVICERRTGDESKSTVFVYNKKGKSVAQFTFDGQITDFKVYKKYAYILSGNYVYCLNLKGEVLKVGSCGFGTEKIVPIAKDSCIVLNDNSFNLCELVSK